ncbi:MAG: hypothetical protein HRU70_07985 [Phycisphaeraceae bacterium]|nr:MAG: hypothetical protein HRU70_07985 [Phycisphaeraceae bacterium]
MTRLHRRAMVAAALMGAWAGLALAQVAAPIGNSAGDGAAADGSSGGVRGQGVPVRFDSLRVMRVTPRGEVPPEWPDNGGIGPREGRCNIVSNLSDANFEGGSFVLQAGMAQGEMFAATYTLLASDFPIRHQLTEVIVGTDRTSVETTMRWSLLFYSGEPTTGTLVDQISSDGELLPHIVIPPGTNGVNLQFLIDPGDPEQLIIPNNGSNRFTVAFRIDGLNAPPANPCTQAPDPRRNSFLATDTGGLQNGTANWLFGLNCGPIGCPSNGGWARFSQLIVGCRPTGDWVSRTTWSSVDCTPGVGACCLPGGGCDQMTVGDCQSIGGTFQGDGSSCVNANCPEPSGACCFSNGFCSVVTQSVCAGAGGRFAGANTNCGTGNTCPTGACCLPTGECVPGLLSGECAAQGGLFRGVGSNCAGADCPQPTGACCFPNGFCGELTEAVCQGAGGAWAGAFTTCVDSNQNGRADVCESGCAADFNDDGFVDFFDADAFVACFEGVECPPGKTADFNNDGFVDFFDLDEFIAAFEAGC